MTGGRRIGPYSWAWLQILALIVVLGVSAYLWRQVAIEKAANASRTQVAHSQQVSNCFTRHSQAPAANQFFAVLKTILRNQIAGLEALIVADPNAAQVPRLRARTRQAQDALDAIVNFSATQRAQIPSLKDCQQLAVELNVPLPRSSG